MFILKYGIVSQRNDNCLQIQHLFTFLELNQTYPEIQAISLVEKTIKKINLYYGQLGSIISKMFKLIICMLLFDMIILLLNFVPKRYTSNFVDQIYILIFPTRPKPLSAKYAKGLYKNLDWHYSKTPQ